MRRRFLRIFALVAVGASAAAGSARALGVDIEPRSFGITTTSLPEAVVGAPYSTTLRAGDAPVLTVTWRISTGLPPAGLFLGADGTLSGTPTTAGSFTFTVTATSIDSSSTDSRQLTLHVIALMPSLTRHVAEVAVRFSATLSVTGGQAPYTWSQDGGLPAGLRVAPDGTVSGVPAEAGSFTLTARVVDANGAGTEVRVPLLIRPRLEIASRRLPAAKAGHAYLAKLSSRGGISPVRWSLLRGTLPHGLMLTANGVVAGKSVSSGTFRISVRVRDALGAAATKKFALIVR